MFSHRLPRRAGPLPRFALLAPVHSVSGRRGRRLARAQRISGAVSGDLGLALLEINFYEEMRQGAKLVVGGRGILHDEQVAARVVGASLRRALGRAGNGRRAFSVRVSM